jgi:hypothetical protein
MGIELKTLIEDTCRQFERNFSAGRTLSKPRRSVFPGKGFLDAAANRTRRLDQLSTTASGTSRTSRDVRLESAKWSKADVDQIAVTNRDFMSTRPSSSVHV